MSDHFTTCLAAKILRAQGFRVCSATLRQWRWRGIGPPFVKLTPGGPCYYSRESLDAWVASRSFKNTAEASAATNAMGQG